MIKVIIMHDVKLDAYDIKFEKAGKYEWARIEGVIQVIKSTIPVSDRTYNPDNKTWTVTARYFSPLEELLKNLNFNISYIKDIRENFFYESTPISTAPTKESLKEQLKRILAIEDSVFTDNDALKKAYRRKALQLHPDRNNGDGSQMSELNSIWSSYNA